MIASQYTARRPIAFALSNRCYYCDVPIERVDFSISGPKANGRTTDHIYLASWPLQQRRWFREEGLLNKRPCCSACNQLRAQVGHCCGALMMILFEAAEQKGNRRAGRIIVEGPSPSKRKKRSARRNKAANERAVAA